jgi:hypothetical protein
MNNEKHFHMLHELLLKKRTCRQHNLQFSYFHRPKKSLFCPNCLKSGKYNPNDLFYFDNLSAIFSHYLNIYEYRECKEHGKVLTCYCINHMKYYCELCKQNCDYKNYSNCYVEVQKNIMFQGNQEEGKVVYRSGKAHIEVDEPKVNNVERPNNISTSTYAANTNVPKLNVSSKSTSNTSGSNNVKLDLSMTGYYFPFINNTNLVLFNFVNNHYKKYKLVSKYNKTLEVIKYLDMGKKYEQVYILKDDGVYYFDIVTEKLEMKAKFNSHIGFDSITGITSDEIVIGTYKDALATLNLKTNKFKSYIDDDVYLTIQDEGRNASMEASKDNKSLFLHFESLNFESSIMDLLVYNNGYSSKFEERKFTKIKLKPQGEIKPRIYSEDVRLFSMDGKIYLRSYKFSEVEIYELLIDELQYRLITSHSVDDFEMNIETKFDGVVIEDEFYFINDDVVLVKYHLDRNNYTAIYEFI